MYRIYNFHIFLYTNRNPIYVKLTTIIIPFDRLSIGP